MRKIEQHSVGPALQSEGTLAASAIKGIPLKPEDDPVTVLRDAILEDREALSKVAGEIPKLREQMRAQTADAITASVSDFQSGLNVIEQRDLRPALAGVALLALGSLVSAVGIWIGH